MRREDAFGIIVVVAMVLIVVAFLVSEGPSIAEHIEGQPETRQVYMGAGITRIELDEVICYRASGNGGMWCHMREDGEE